MNYRYFVFGLQVQSEILLPELLVSVEITAPDVIITIGETPSRLANCQKKGVTYEVAKDEFLLDLKDIARFYVSNGNHIIIEPNSKGEERDIRLFLLGSCFGAILHQRKILAMHASAIVHEGKAVLFTGISGAGKSTTANAFRLEGYKMLTDDVCPIQFVKNKPYALPGYPQSKLWEDALENMNIQFEHLEYIRNGIQKRRLPITDTFMKKPMEVKALYILQSHNESDVKILKVNDADKFRLIKRMTYRRYLVNGLGIQSFHFMNVSQLANQISIKRLVRPQLFSVNEVVTTIRKDLEALKSPVYEA